MIENNPLRPSSLVCQDTASYPRPISSAKAWRPLGSLAYDPNHNLSEKPTDIPHVPDESDPSGDPLAILRQIRQQINDLRRDIQVAKEQLDFNPSSSEKESAPE